MRRTAPSLAVLTLVVLLGLLASGAVAGCGREPEGRAAQPEVDPKAWATDVCGVVRPWTAEVRRLQEQATARLAAGGAPESTKRELVALFGSAEEASDAALRKVRGAGVPKVEDGRRIADQFVAALTSARDAFGKAKVALVALPTTDRATFTAGVAQVRRTMAQESAASSRALGDVRSPELDRAFAAVPECR